MAAPLDMRRTLPPRVHGAGWPIQAGRDSWQNLAAMKREQKITLGEMRSNNGPRRLIVYCSDFKCSHHVVVDADCWPDSLRLSESRLALSARFAVAVAPTSGRYSK